MGGNGFIRCRLGYKLCLVNCVKKVEVKEMKVYGNADFLGINEREYEGRTYYNVELRSGGRTMRLQCDKDCVRDCYSLAEYTPAAVVLEIGAGSKGMYGRLVEISAAEKKA